MLARSHERGRAEELYRQQEILLDSVADGICGVDRRGLVSFVNPAAARMLGAVASGITGKPVHDLLHGAATPNNQCKPDCTPRHLRQPQPLRGFPGDGAAVCRDVPDGRVAPRTLQVAFVGCPRACGFGCVGSGFVDVRGDYSFLLTDGIHRDTFFSICDGRIGARDHAIQLGDRVPKAPVGRSWDGRCTGAGRFCIPAS